MSDFYGIRITPATWLGSHPNALTIKIDESNSCDGPLAKVNLKTREVILYAHKITQASMILDIPTWLLSYYSLSHELGHIIYQLTDGIVIEELFSHNYAYQDTYAHLYVGYPHEDVWYSRLEKLEKILILD